MMHVVRKIVILAFVLLGFTHSSANSANSNAAQRAITLRYAIMDKATRNADTKNFASVLANNYEEFDSDNRMLKRSEVIEKFNAFFGQQKRQFKTKITSAEINVTSAKVVCQRIDIGEGIFWNRTDLWKLSNGTWFLTQSKVDDAGLIEGGEAQKLLKQLQ